MKFNIEKCKVMHIGGKNQKFKYEMEGQELGTAEVEKDLGILVTDNLKPSAQCAKATKKANGILGQIVRAFHFRTKAVLRKLFKAFVRPVLEYAVAVWSPWTEADCETLEKVQRRAIRLMSNVRGAIYEEKLKYAG